MFNDFTKLTYQAYQQGKSYFSLAHKFLGTRVKNHIYPNLNKSQPISQQAIANLQDRLNRLLESDWQDAQQGIYAYDLLFDNSWLDFCLYYPAMCVDMLQVWERANRQQYQDFSQPQEGKIYPSYYLQNFHHQTDGYLSDLSANLYDLQVEILFNGTGDGMRRRILSPLKHQLKKFLPLKHVRILDVGCGTGRTLKLLRGAIPEASLFGVDLSPNYLRKANQLLAENYTQLPQLIQANAEELPYLDNYFHGVTSVFLFHELPAAVRQTVIEQCFRVTKPGGVFIICDSIQTSDSPDLVDIINNFPRTFHEPYYINYSLDDLVARLEKAGFAHVRTEVHFLSKYIIACKPD